MISVIIPVYNEKKSSCIISINESLTKCYDFEIIFVNDGSIDASASILDELEKIIPILSELFILKLWSNWPTGIDHSV